MMEIRFALVSVIVFSHTRRDTNNEPAVLISIVELITECD